MFAKAVAVLVAATAVSGALGDVITITPDRDNTMFSEDVTLSNGAGDHFFTGQTNAVGVNRRALIRFDIASAIPPGSVITDVQMTLYMSRSKNSFDPVSIHRLTTDWGEGASHAGGEEGAGATALDNDATWDYTFYNTANPPASPAWISPGGDYIALDSATITVGDVMQYYTWGSTVDMVADTQSWLDGPSTNFGWIIISDETTRRTAARFDSRTNSTVAQRPALQITFTPPAGTGACCFADGNCSVLSMIDCTTAGGTYQGDGISCTPNPCPQPDGACCFDDASCIDTDEATCLSMGGNFQGPGSTCATTDCPLILEKYVDLMPLPPIAVPTSGTIGGTATYDIDIIQTTQQLHRDLAPTTLWTYEGVFPGPTIVARKDNPVTVTFNNELRDEFGVYRTDHLLDVDLCAHGAEDVAKTIVHLHGGHVPADVDGYPEDTVLPGNSFTYTYPNYNQDSALIWYHCHALGITRLNVYAGLAGGYIVRDANEDALSLPTGEFEVPLIIQDRTLNPDGSLSYPSASQETFFGELMLVNGMVWPHYNVKQAKYRFRTLNGCNSRVLTLSFGGLPFDVISSEGGFLNAPVTRTVITLGGAERADLLVDFSSLPPGTEVFLTNAAQAPYPNGNPANALPEVMKFIVIADTGPTPVTPVVLNNITPLQELDADRSRNFILRKIPDPHGTPGCPTQLWAIHDLLWDDITEIMTMGDMEVWEFDNLSGMMHPMHMHLVFFQVLDKTPLDGAGNPIGPPVAPDALEAGWKDTVRVNPNERVRVIARFDDYTGLYPYHCHILEHEDHEMMRQFQVDRPCDGDANRDGVIDVNDISFVLFRLGAPCPIPGCEGDANWDGVIDVNDITHVLFRLGPCD
jgi:spore coat protein A